MGRANRLSAQASHLVGDMVMQATLGAFAGDSLIARVCGASDDIAILEAGLGPNDGWKRKSADREQCNNQSLHMILPGQCRRQNSTGGSVVVWLMGKTISVAMLSNYTFDDQFNIEGIRMFRRRKRQAKDRWPALERGGRPVSMLSLARLN
jgi:hypothetical protein